MTLPRNRTRMTDDEIADVRRRYEAGESVKALARSAGRSESTIDAKLRGIRRHPQPAPRAPNPLDRVGMFGSGALPAGHSATWGAISSRPWLSHGATHALPVPAPGTGTVGQVAAQAATTGRKNPEGPVRANTAVSEACPSSRNETT